MDLQATDLHLAIAELNTAESFLEFFGVSYQPSYLMPRRIKFLRLVQQRLARIAEPFTWQDYQTSVFRAYCDLEMEIGIALSESHCASCQSGCLGEKKC